MANATIADAEKGSKYFEAAVEGICNLLRKFE
jgi:creatinine amidohydrolase/Fe(II)-dependent formamide hydrolase-like protein